MYLVGLHIYYKMIHGPYNIKYVIHCTVACFDLFGHLMAINIKAIKVLYTTVLDGINNSDLNFIIK